MPYKEAVKFFNECFYRSIVQPAGISSGTSSRFVAEEWSARLAAYQPGPSFEPGPPDERAGSGQATDAQGRNDEYLQCQVHLLRIHEHETRQGGHEPRALRET